MSNVFSKTLSYTQCFSKFTNQETISEVRKILTQKKLHKFEIAMMANLCPTSVEEARVLIPSLEGRYDDEELKQLLDDLNSMISFTK